MKKITSIMFLCGIIMCTAMNTANAQGGSVGELAWNFNAETGTLTINGEGAIPDYVETTNNKPWDAYKTSITQVVIENGVTRIGNCAFYGYSGITSLSIGSGVLSIGADAFRVCSGLTALVIPDSVTQLGYSAFSGCTSMTSVSIGSGIDEISNAVFLGSGLTEVTIPPTVTSIGSSAFADCSRLATVNYNATRASNVVETHAHFSNCPSLKTVVIGDNVEYVPSYMFYGLASIETLTIGNSVTAIGAGTFWGCSGLTAVTIPEHVTEIGSRAFSATGITELVIPNNVITLHNSAFSDCTQLASVSIGSGITALPGWVFGNTGLTEVTIPETVTSIDPDAFYGSNQLATLYFNAANVAGWDRNTMFSTYALPGLRTVTVGNSVLQIPQWFLSGHTGVTSVTLGSSVTAINRYAFNSCSSITEIVIPNSVTFIADGTFSNCSALASITIGSGVTEIMSGAFSNTGITEITVPEKVISLGNAVFGECASLETVYFNAVNYPYFVETSEPFRNCPLLTSFVFGNQVEKIPSYICYGMGSLKNIIIGSSVTSIGTGAFWNCSRLLSATIPNSVKTLGYWAFRGCVAMTGVSIGSGITEISSAAFMDCGLTEVTIPQSVTSIGADAFNNCSSLQTVYFNARNCSDMSGLNEHFDNCNALTEAVIGDDVRRIPGYLFYTYDGLGIETVTIGSSVREIGYAAFANCTWLETVTNKAPRPQTIEAIVFEDVEKEYCTLYVPAASIPDYQAAAVWQEFGSIEPITVDIKDNTLANVTVYGNGNSVYIVNKNSVNLKSVQIIDVQGRIVYDGRGRTFSTLTEEIPVNGAGGICIVQLVSEDGKVLSAKVILND